MSKKKLHQIKLLLEAIDRLNKAIAFHEGGERIDYNSLHNYKRLRVDRQQELANLLNKQQFIGSEQAEDKAATPAKIDEKTPYLRRHWAMQAADRRRFSPNAGEE